MNDIWCNILIITWRFSFNKRWLTVDKSKWKRNTNNFIPFLRLNSISLLRYSLNPHEIGSKLRVYEKEVDLKDEMKNAAQARGPLNGVEWRSQGEGEGEGELVGVWGGVEE